MPLYTVTARDASGRTISQVKDAASVGDLVAELRKSGLTVIGVKSEGGQAAGGPGAAAPTEVQARAKSQGGLFQKKVKVSDMAAFCRQMSTMLRAGLSLLDSLETIAAEMDNPQFKTALLSVMQDVEAGAKFSDALKKHPHIFNFLMCSMVEAGEVSGSLDTILEQLGVFFKRRYKLQSQIKSATAYPKFVAGFFVLIVGGIFTFLVPQFADLFKQFGADLPVLTKVLIFISDAIVSFWWITVPAVIGAIAAFIFWRRTPQGAESWDRLVLKMPLFGPLAVKSGVSRFTMTLSTLVKNGITLDQSLEITAKTLGNLILEQAVLDARQKLIQGYSLHQALTESGMFPGLMTKMVKVGEDSGSLPDMLNDVTEYYEDEVSATVGAITSMIEPALIVSLGAVVLVVILGIYLPIFGLSRAAAKGSK
ncbi:MAG: type II secretion system F family protein [Planctomycetes bacterium]|jgi:type IV pilus assembly protein PilC|nr:type II secretion system F family protein [Planctomycetota bacterium]MCL4731920.1 type II secretion system F family protein [Planctomycetota bacterium]